MYKPLKYFKLLEVQIRTVSTHVRTNQKSHYDALGISAKATQADIKSAYYKLSMMYHPDKNKDSEDAAKKFRDITEAYEILGNVKSRKLYDRGLYVQNVGTFSEDDTPFNKFYKSRDTKSRPPTAYGRTTVYDFDEWSRIHYGATFQRDARFREKVRFRKLKEEQMEEDIKSEKAIFLIGLLFLFSLYIFYEKDYDNPDNVTVLSGNIVVTPKMK